MVNPFRSLACLAACLWLTVPASADQNIWSPSPMPGEADRAAIGCSDSHSDDAWACIVVRCEADRTLGLYAEIDGGGDGAGEWMLRVGPLSWLVKGDTGAAAGPYSARLHTQVFEIVPALKREQVVRMDSSLQLSDGLETIPLRGSSRAIERVEAACGIDADHELDQKVAEANVLVGSAEPAVTNSEVSAANEDIAETPPSDIPAVDPSSPNAQGVALNRMGEEVAAFALIKQAAEAGDIRAKANLGMLLLVGSGTPRDPDQGLKLLKEASAAGDPFAPLGLGIAFSVDLSKGIPAVIGLAATPNAVTAYRHFVMATRTPAAPEAWFHIQDAGMFAGIGDYDSGAACLRAQTSGHRIVVNRCPILNGKIVEATKQLAELEGAVMRPRWSAGKNLEAGYVKEFFADTDANLRTAVMQQALYFRLELGIDIPSHLQKLGYDVGTLQ